MLEIIELLNLKRDKNELSLINLLVQSIPHTLHCFELQAQNLDRIAS